MTTPPVLLITFNRPQSARLVLDAIRPAAPRKLYLAVDGPRADRPEEKELTEQCCDLATEIDWECEVHTLAREKNLGCRRAVSGAITWFFEHEPEGIILEDDCVPHLDFFRFAGELLERYREDPKVMAITGDNFHSNMGDLADSYYFSMFNHVWGWASWRRAWALYDAELESFQEETAHDVLDTPDQIPGFAKYWKKQIGRTKSGHINTWDYIWTWSCWKAGGLTCTPRVNMVTNIGFGADATHTTSFAVTGEFPSLPAKPLGFPLVHPGRVEANKSRDRANARLWRFSVYPGIVVRVADLIERFRGGRAA